jgi:acetyl-CoA carboxylase biotin carboxyl carrier protein
MMPMPMAMAAPAAAMPAQAAPVQASAPASQASGASASASKFKELTSPMVGTFYASNTPGGAPLATVGTAVKSGQVLCIIEAMKIMNEIESDVTGVIEEVCVQNEMPVEYGTVLFRIRPG